jgi:hypothetical protein
MKYGEYATAQEYNEALEQEHKANPDTLFHVVLSAKYMNAETGMANINRDFELRYGIPCWKRFGVELEMRMDAPIFFPAGTPLKTTQQIISFRSKQKRDSFTLEGFDPDEVKDEWLRFLLTKRFDGKFRLKDFRHAHKYAQGKPAKLRYAQNITIKADRNGIPQMHRKV